MPNKEAAPAADPYALEFIVDKIFPKRKLHLISGPSGAGKTTFIFNMIRDWSIGSPIMGFTSHPAPFQYLALDRDYDEVGDRVRAAGLEPSMLNISCVLDEGLTFDKLMTRVEPKTEVLFIDAFATLTPEGRINDYAVVANFLRRVLNTCKAKGLTIFGTPHATKTKEGDSYLHGRHKVLGSVAWGAFSSTLVFIDSVNPGNPAEPGRLVSVLPRCAASIEKHFKFSEAGGLVETASPNDLTAAPSRGLPQTAQSLLAALPVGEPLSPALVFALVRNGHAPGVTEKDAFRLLNDLCAAGLLTRPQHADVYIRPA